MWKQTRPASRSIGPAGVTAYMGGPCGLASSGSAAENSVTGRLPCLGESDVFLDEWFVAHGASCHLPDKLTRKSIDDTLALFATRLGAVDWLSSLLIINREFVAGRGA